MPTYSKFTCNNSNLCTSVLCGYVVIIVASVLDTEQKNAKLMRLTSHIRTGRDVGVKGYNVGVKEIAQQVMLL